MKNKEFYKLLKKNKSNSGFTLTELLVGLVVGTIVIGGLGFGLVNLLQGTLTGNAFSGARNESTRALDFISDEVKRAVAIENNSANATGFNAAGKTVVFALDIPEVNTDATLGSDADLGTPERIVYFLQAAGATWQGPLVLHRWGPPLDANGNYTNGAWGEEALIDGINDTALLPATITAQCDPAGPGNLFPSPAAPTGFYACIQDDDLDGNAGEPEDADNIGISAELYLTSGVDVGAANLDTYTANTQVVARSRVAPVNNSEDFQSYSASLLSLNPQYGRPGCWNVRNDFGKGRNPSFDPGAVPVHPDALDDIYTWAHENNRQPQPLNIDTTQPFTMVASAFALPTNTGSPQCLARGNSLKQKLVSIDNDGNNPVYSNVDANGNDVTAGNEVPVDGSEKIHTYEQKVWHTIEFPQTGDSSSEIADKRETFNGKATDNPDVKGDGSVYLFRNDSVVPDVGGYDADKDGIFEPADGDQPSLRNFLQDPNQDGNTSDAYVNPDGTFKPGTLGPDQRLVAFEIGQTEATIDGDPNPGFDLQDNMFIISSDAFSSYSEN